MWPLVLKTISYCSFFYHTLSTLSHLYRRPIFFFFCCFVYSSFLSHYHLLFPIMYPLYSWSLKHTTLPHSTAINGKSYLFFTVARTGFNLQKRNLEYFTARAGCIKYLFQEIRNTCSSYHSLVMGLRLHLGFPIQALACERESLLTSTTKKTFQGYLAFIMGFHWQYKDVERIFKTHWPIFLKDRS